MLNLRLVQHLLLLFTVFAMSAFVAPLSIVTKYDKLFLKYNMCNVFKFLKLKKGIMAYNPFFFLID